MNQQERDMKDFESWWSSEPRSQSENDKAGAKVGFLAALESERKRSAGLVKMLENFVEDWRHNRQLHNNKQPDSPYSLGLWDTKAMVGEDAEVTLKQYHQERERL